MVSNLLRPDLINDFVGVPAGDVPPDFNNDPPPPERLWMTMKEIDVNVTDLEIGDIIRVRPGENFPIDGEIVDGESTVNQSSITGEALPVDKSKGSIACKNLKFI